MARKKEGKMPVSQEDNAQAQHLLAQFHQIAGYLHASRSRDEVETALNDITSMPESAQTAFLKALSRERDVDAADILLAMYEFSPVKPIRKEARRCLIGLEEARIYPQWDSSVGHIATISFTPSYLSDIEVEEDEDEDEDDEEDIVRSGMPPEEVLTSFLESLEWGTDKLAYGLLSSDSSIRNGLSKDEWVEHHRAWAREADPTAFKTEFSRLLDPEQANIDLPASLEEDVPALKKFEVGWSIRVSDTPLNDTIQELPVATAINRETRRHWFWTTYTLVQEQDEWRIQSMTDEVVKTRNLSIAELQERIQQLAGYLDEFSKQHNPLDLDEYPSDSDQIKALEEARWRSGHTLAYYDALIKKAPDERAHYQLAAARSLALNDFERSLVYFDLMLERFPEKRDDETLLQLGGIQIKFIQDLQDRLDFLSDEDEVVQRFRELAEANLRESLSLDDNYLGHLLLAQLFKNDDDRLDEAEEQLHQARALAPNVSTEAVVERDMGTLAMIREDYEQALEHYRRVAEIHPDSTKAWADIADAYSGLENFEAAEASYRHAIELQPDDVNLYVGLSTMYMANQQFDRSRELWDEGLRANPDSADFRFYLAMTLAERGEFLRAQTLLEEAEQIDPHHEMAPMISQMLNAFKTTKLPVVNADEQRPVEPAPVPERKQLSGVKPPTKFSKARKRKKK